LIGSIQADQSISFQLMQDKLRQFVDIIRKNPAVDTAVGSQPGAGLGPGGGSTNSGTVFASLKPLGDRDLSAEQVIGAVAERTRRRARRHADPAGGGRSRRRRSLEQRAVSVHAAGLDLRRAERMDTEDRRRPSDRVRSRRRQQRPAETRACRPA